MGNINCQLITNNINLSTTFKERQETLLSDDSVDNKTSTNHIIMYILHLCHVVNNIWIFLKNRASTHVGHIKMFTYFSPPPHPLTSPSTLDNKLISSSIMKYMNRYWEKAIYSTFLDLNDPPDKILHEKRCSHVDMAIKQGPCGHMTGFKIIRNWISNSNEQDQLHRIRWQFLQILILLIGNSCPSPYLQLTA